MGLGQGCCGIGLQDDRSALSLSFGEVPVAFCVTFVFVAIAGVPTCFVLFEA